MKEGDYLARREERPDKSVRAHSMVVVGWLADDGSDVDPLNFDETRNCNRLLVVDGNTGDLGAPGSGSLGSTVDVSTRVVCRQAENPAGYSIDPVCGDIDGDGVDEQCGVRLWDTLSDGDPPKSSFFIDMSY